MHSNPHVLFNHTLVLVFIDVIMDIKIFSVYCIDPGHYNLKKSANHSTAVIPYMVCIFQRVTGNCHFIYIVAVELYTLIIIIIHVRCCKFTAVKSYPS